MSKLLAQAQSFSASLKALELQGLSWGTPTQEPILALHGWLDNAASFGRLAPLCPDFYWLAPDLAGHGFSDHRPRGVPYYLWDNLADLAELQTQQGWGACHLVAHSMGAAVATLYAAVYPERVKSLWLIDGMVPVTYLEEDLPLRMREAIEKRTLLEGRTSLGYGRYEDALQARMQSRFGVDQEAAEALLARSLSQRQGRWVWHTDPALRLTSVLRLSEAQVRGFLQAVQCPITLFMPQAGIAETLTQGYRDYVKHLEVVHLPGGHHVHLEVQGAEVIAACLQRGIHF